jgi:hypothetical protein
MHPRYPARTTIAALLTTVLAAAAPAQLARPYNTLVAINPLGIPWDIFQVEVERVVSMGATIGVVGGYTDFDDRIQTTFDIKARYYPGEEVLNRLSTGLTAGYTRFSTRVFGSFDPSTGQSNESRETLSAPTIGVILDYNWVHGTSRRFVVGGGVGAKRILASPSERERLQLERAYFTGRFVIGLAF